MRNLLGGVSGFFDIETEFSVDNEVRNENHQHQGCSTSCNIDSILEIGDTENKRGKSGIESYLNSMIRSKCDSNGNAAFFGDKEASEEIENNGIST